MMRRIRIGMMAAVAVGSLVGAGDARAGILLAFDFTAEDASGRTMAGWFGLTGIGGGSLLFLSDAVQTDISIRMDISIELDGARYSYSVPDPAAPNLHEITIQDGVAGLAGDFYNLRSPEVGGPPFFEIHLEDVDGTVFSTYKVFPRSFDLDEFEVRRVTFTPAQGVGFSGTITSITAFIPESSTLALCGPVVLIGGLAGWRRRWRKAT